MARSIKLAIGTMTRRKKTASSGSTDTNLKSLRRRLKLLVAFMWLSSFFWFVVVILVVFGMGNRPYGHFAIAFMGLRGWMMFCFAFVGEVLYLDTLPAILKIIFRRKKAGEEGLNRDTSTFRATFTRNIEGQGEGGFEMQNPMGDVKVKMANPVMYI
jgi:hypothetical protein